MISYTVAFLISTFNHYFISELQLINIFLNLKINIIRYSKYYIIYYLFSLLIFYYYLYLVNTSLLNIVFSHDIIAIEIYPNYNILYKLNYTFNIHFRSKI